MQVLKIILLMTLPKFSYQHLFSACWTFIPTKLIIIFRYKNKTTKLIIIYKIELIIGFWTYRNQ